MGTTAYVVLAATAVYGADQQARAGRAQRASARRQFELQQKQAEIDNIRNARTQIRAARAATGSIVNLGAGSGTLFSSGVQGGVSDVQSQLASNLSYQTDTRNLAAAGAQNQLDAANKISQFQTNATYAQAFGTIFAAGSKQFGDTGGAASVKVDNGS